MIQRPRSAEDELDLAKQQLLPHFEQLAQLSEEHLTSSDSGELVISMISELTNPCIGIQLIRNALSEAQFPFLMQYQMIFDKAEMFYMQSLMHDLIRIKNDEPILQISKQQIKQCVQQLNWKFNIEHSSVLNKSQEVGDNIDLMKFFEGVRSYQTWNENMKRESLEKLKERAHQIEIQLTLKKGFITSKIAQIITEARKRNQSEIFFIAKQKKTYERNFNVFSKIMERKKSESFEIIKYQSQLRQQALSSLEEMLNKYRKKRLVIDIKRFSVQFKNKTKNITKLASAMHNIKRTIETSFKSVFFKLLNIKPMIKASKFTQGLQILTKISQKVAVRYILKQLNIPVKAIFQNLDQRYLEKVSQMFTLLKENYVQVKLRKPNVSDRIKGKILASLDKHEKEPISLKKTFDKWYLNTHEEQFSKKVYNIWLQGHISKFTFFMRLKNMCDLINRQMTSKEMRNFIKILCQKFGKYEEHNKKVMLIKWVTNSRRLKKIENMFNLLETITSETKTTFERYSVEKVLSFCRKRQAVKNYLSKYLLSFIQIRKAAFDKVVKVNNIKKQWGKRRLRKILLNVTQQMMNGAKQTLDVFKTNRLQGREKKLKQCRRTINTDTLFMSTFFHIWRFNESQEKSEQKMTIKNIIQNKTNSLTNLALINSKTVNSNLKDILYKFKKNSQLKVKRISGIKSKFMKVINDNESNCLKETLNILQSIWREGNIKKQRLVTKFVQSMSVKEKVAYSIFKTNAKRITDMMKIDASTKVLQLLEERVKDNLKIFNRKLFTYKILQKIGTNRANNVQLALNCWKAMPLRMRWTLRRKVIQMSDTIKKLSNQRLVLCNTSFKNCMIEGKSLKRKGVYVMAGKFETVIRKYFQQYYQNACKLKQSNKRELVGNLFENIRIKSKDSFSVMMLAEQQWPKKRSYLQKLDLHAKERVRNYFLCWHKNANALTYCNKILDQKKIRVLQNLGKLLNKQEQVKTKGIIQTLNRHRRVHNLQVNFLKKLCQSQAGKQLKGFMIWKSMPVVKNKSKIIHATTFAANLSNLKMKNLGYTLGIMQACRRHGKEKRYQSINRLVSSKCSEISKYFHKWLHHKRLVMLNIKNKSVQILFNGIIEAKKSQFDLLYSGEEANEKRRGLQLILSWWDDQKRYYIKKWYKNTNNLKLRDIQRKQILIAMNDVKIRNQKRTIVNQIIAKFKTTREDRLQEKKKLRVQSIIRILENEEAFKRTLLNETVDKLKYNHYRGNFLKNQIFHKFLREKIGQVHQCISIWNGLAMQAKEIHKQRIVTSNFDSINETMKQSYKVIFARGRELMIKKNALDKIFVAKEIQFKGFFTLWRQNTKQLKILGQLDKKAKASILERISKIINATSTQTVVNTIQKFSMNYKIQKVQKKFIERLLQTKSGKVINAFNSWKTIPYNQKMGKFKKYQKFYFGLQAFYKNRLKTIQIAFCDSHDDGNLMKKQSILKLFQMTSLGIRRFYNRWTRLTKEKHTLMQVHSTFKVFESAEIVIANQYQIMFQDERAYRIKIAAINKLIAASRGTTQNYFNIWRENVKLINLQNSMDKESKKMALAIFNKVIGNSATGQTINIISKFKKNASMGKIAKTFFNRLMQTKTGKVLQFFAKLKTVPDAKLNKRKKKGIIFQSKLHNFVLRRMRTGLTPFKECTYDSNIKKKYCIDRLMRACMGENKKKFLIWRNVVREGKILRHTQLCQKIFNNVENIYRDNFLVINKDTSSEIQKKKSLCRKLINNSLFVQHHAYLLWKEAYHIDDIKIKTKQNNTQSHLRNLFQIFRQHQNKKAVQTIGTFRKILENQTIVQSNYYKDYMNQKCLEFYNALKSRELSNKNCLIAALKANKAEFALGERSQKLLNAFQVILKVSQTNMQNVLSTQDQTNLVVNSLNQLYQNQWNNMRASIHLWKLKTTVLSHQVESKDERKKEALIKLKELVSNKKSTQIKNVIQQFKNNTKVKKTKLRACLKICMIRSDNYRSSFLNWKGLPYQQAKKTKTKAAKFEKSLFNFMRNRLKQVHSVFKAQCLNGVMKKQNAVRRIVRSKMTEMYHLLFKWRKANNENKIKEKIITLDKVFSDVQTTFKNNFSIFDGSKVQDQRKVHAIAQIFNKNVSKLREYLLIWKRTAKNIKYQQFDKFMRNFNPEDFNKRLMQHAFLMIQKKNDMETMKGYINSLWKWKMSNIQAIYYSKFIRVFKEGQEMVKLSTILNKKIDEHIHYAFRSILSAGSERSNRKKQIVAKYLTKRLRNYFITFKNATSKTQINVWKSKYTDSIKSKIIYDIFFSLILKCKFSAFNKLKGYQAYAESIDNLDQKSQNYKKELVKFAFQKIQWSGQSRLLTLTAELSQKSLKNVLQDSFDQLNNFKKMSKLSFIVSQTVYKNLLYHAFNKLKSRKERSIRSKLSIILLETLISNAKNMKKKKAIIQFNKNRMKNVCAEKIYRFLSNRYLNEARNLFENGKVLVNLNKLLLRFKRGQTIQRIIEKQDQQLKKHYLNRMRKKQNKWMELAIQKFATRASIRSSPAICLWRLKTYVMNS